MKGNENRLHLLLASLAVALAVAAALLATSPCLPMGWDEGNSILRAESPGWPYTTRHEGHPAFYGIVIAAGQRLSSAWLPPLEAARFGPIALFALAAGAMFYRMAREWSLAAACGSVAALLLQPRLFAHAHFASFDGPLVSCWMLAWATFAPALRDWRWAIAWGVALGMTLSTKATGWLAPLPFAAWTVLCRDRPRLGSTKGFPSHFHCRTGFLARLGRLGKAVLQHWFLDGSLRAMAIGLPVALVTFFLLNPPLWSEPVSGITMFFSLNLNRAAHGLNISTQFFGRMYNLDHPLPWYNTLVWTAITVPLPILLLAALGLASILKERLKGSGLPPTAALGLLLVAHWAVLLIVRAFPFAPPHDAERLILPSFAFLAALAGAGTHCMVASLSAGAQEPAATRPGCVRNRRRWALLTLPLLYLAAALALWRYTPQWLSYYNLLIGGLPGAAARGMEPTYYWDALDREVIIWLEEHTGPGEKVRHAAAPPENLELLRRWGRLRCEYRPQAPGEYRWYVLQHRPSAWQLSDRWLVEHGTPSFVRSIPSRGWRAWRVDVALISIYPYEAYLTARKNTSWPTGDGQNAVHAP